MYIKNKTCEVVMFYFLVKNKLNKPVYRYLKTSAKSVTFVC